ncbi:uncharacterized protein LOC111364567 [Spodoptera litura]|uniref:Uncharacterized protein LOC111364567 n=1 Tax=Spodoptera litura TaxID=69820 RepID=A0A9J7EWJ8_SPOLT|nr:uncharacterized protein LOC111364567 [Spodoptera litura]
MDEKVLADSIEQLCLCSANEPQAVPTDKNAEDEVKVEVNKENPSPSFSKDWLPPELLDKEFTALPTYIDDKGIIYLYDINLEHIREFIRKALTVKFRVNFEEPDPKTMSTKWSVGQPCTVILQIPYRCYRGRVLEVNQESETCVVHFIDYGYVETCPFANLRKAVPLRRIPPYSLRYDTDPQRRALIKEKTNKYLSYAEEIYKNHLCDTEQTLLPERDEPLRPLHCPIPLSMLRRPYEELALYRVLDILGSSIMLVLHRTEQAYYAMKVIQKIPNNLTEFDEFFLQRTNETRQPVLPTVIPYMVPLQAYIETNNLIFLILSYAPGKKLFEYIKNYSKSLPTTPAREVNLENVFTEPKNKNFEKNDNNCDIEEATNNNKELSVNELVLNSQKLLLNVDKVLCESSAEVTTSEGDCKVDNACDTTPSIKRSPCGGRELPASAVCRWAAEILTALHCLHNAGVICRDLNPSNILLGDRGQVILTYFQYYPGSDMRVSVLRPGSTPRPHIAPEIYTNTLDETPDLDHVCDYWSFGAVLYELVCGIPLSHYHGSLFTSHTILQLPDGLPLETQSILTQLLTYEPSERLGAGKDGVEEIKRHPFFKHIDWQHVYDSWAAPD